MSTSGIDRPSNTYWVVSGRFAAGEYPGAKNRGDAADKLRALMSAGIDHFVDLTEPHELAPYAGIAVEEATRLGLWVEHKRYPIRDVQVPRARHEMAVILDAIDAALEEGRTVYVHCWALRPAMRWERRWSSSSQARSSPSTTWSEAGPSV